MRMSGALYKTTAAIRLLAAFRLADLLLQCFTFIGRQVMVMDVQLLYSILFLTILPEWPLLTKMTCTLFISDQYNLRQLKDKRKNFWQRQA